MFLTPSDFLAVWTELGNSLATVAIKEEKAPKTENKAEKKLKRTLIAASEI